MNFTNRSFGIELEIAVPNTVNTEALVAAITAAGINCVAETYNHSTRRHWKLVSDASVRGGRNSWGVELVSPVLSGEAGLADIRKVCAVLNRLGVTANRTCGFHVHHGASDFKSKHFEHLFALYRNSERAIDSLMPLSRRNSVNVYCKTLKTKSVNVLMSDRFHKLNLNSFARHGTVEFRHHAGTVNADKVTAWVQFTQRMVERAKRKVNAADHDYTWYDVKQLLGLVHTSDEKLKQVAAYYDTRRAELAVRAEVETGPAPIPSAAARLAAARVA